MRKNAEDRKVSSPWPEHLAHGIVGSRYTNLLVTVEKDVMFWLKIPVLLPQTQLEMFQSFGIINPDLSPQIVPVENTHFLSQQTRLEICPRRLRKCYPVVSHFQVLKQLPWNSTAIPSTSRYESQVIHMYWNVICDVMLKCQYGNSLMTHTNVNLSVVCRNCRHCVLVIGCTSTTLQHDIVFIPLLTYNTHT